MSIATQDRPNNVQKIICWGQSYEGETLVTRIQLDSLTAS